MGLWGLCFLGSRRQAQRSIIKTSMGKEWSWAATDRAASSGIIPQTKLVGKTAEEQGQRPGISPVLLEERKPSDTGLSEE